MSEISLGEGTASGKGVLGRGNDICKGLEMRECGSFPAESFAPPLVSRQSHLSHVPESRIHS